MAITLKHNNRTLCSDWRELRKIYHLVIKIGIKPYRGGLLEYTDSEWRNYYDCYPVICFDINRGVISVCGCEQEGNRNYMSTNEFIDGLGGFSSYRGNILKHNFSMI
jgi:hypothetical protein